MKKRLLNIITAILFVSFAIPILPASADSDSYGITMIPPNQVVVLNPGEQYTSSFSLANPQSNTTNFDFITKVLPFYVDDDLNIQYDTEESYNQMKDWITVKTTEGSVAPNEQIDVHFTINVPKNAPAGGQYASIVVESKNDNDANSSNGLGLNIKQNIAMAHIIYAEITGTTIKTGEINDENVPSFLLGGNISGSASIKNTGNVHGKAKYTLQIFPIFSGEEIFTNEESPETMLILPDRTYYHETVWENTPAVGIFNVVYTIEFEGVTSQVKKMVIKCPIWLLFIIIFVIAAIIIYIIVRAKSHKSRKNKPATAEE